MDVKRIITLSVLGLILLATGLTYANLGNFQQTNNRYKSGQSDEEICIKWSHDVQTCKNDADYRKLYADVIKNGGCITSVPDVGLMVRSWSYCKETSEKINLLFLPTGEVFNFIEEGEYGRFLDTPLTDTEYQQLFIGINKEPLNRGSI